MRDILHGEEARAKGGRRVSESQQTERRFSQWGATPRVPGPVWNQARPDERREVEVPRRQKYSEQAYPEGGPRGRRGSATRVSGQYWQSPRRDERRDPDVLRKRKFDQRGELADVIHGEEGRQRGGRPINTFDLPPGPSHVDPFWMLERQDERRDPDFEEKRKYGRQPIQAAELVHGEDFRMRWDQPRMVRLPNIDDDYGNEMDEDDDSEPFPFKKTCKCGPAPTKSGPDRVMLERDFEASDGGGGKKYERGRRYDQTAGAQQMPAARVSCAPQADISNFDQPNVFMRKLYEKYPYLYQVLSETPPEDLMSRVFKDRFLSTYQVDYLHLGSGRGKQGLIEGQQEAVHSGEEAGQGQTYSGPDGEPEPNAIPGCSYRHSQKGDFGRKKHEEKSKEEKEEELPVEKEEPVMSEYQATIGKLGAQIIQDQLFVMAEKIKANQRRK